jgi:dienelactone hydrolase
MKQLLLTIIILLSFLCTKGQKRRLDPSLYNSWQEIGLHKISNDGKFIVYSYGAPATGHHLVIHSTENSWEKRVAGTDYAVFTEDSRYLIYQAHPDTLSVLNTRTRQVRCIPNTSSFRVSKYGKGSWLAYQLSGSQNKLVLLNLSTGSKEDYWFVTNYTFSDNGRFLLIESTFTENGTTLNQLQWLDVSTGKLNTVWRDTAKLVKFCMDLSGEQLALVIESKGELKQAYTIRYYRVGMDTSKVWLQDGALNINGAMLANRYDLPQFSTNGKHLFIGFRLNDVNSRTADDNGSGVNIWSYSDISLQSHQLQRLEAIKNRIFVGAVGVNDSKVVRIERNNDEEVVGAIKSNRGNFILIKEQQGGDLSELNWNNRSRPALYLVSINDGTRKLIKKEVLKFMYGDYQLSPTGKFLVYYDSEQQNYFSYDILSDALLNISADVPVKLYNEKYDYPDLPRSNGMCAWVEGEESILVYDNYDIWQLDLRKKKRAVNVTNDYGRRNKLVLRFFEPTGQPPMELPVVNTKADLLLVGFNLNNKYNGFLQKKLGVVGAPELLTMGPYIYYYPFNSYNIYPSVPLKARDAKKFLVKRMSTTEAPNVFFSTDLREFTRLSDLQPQREYNWLTSELLHWKVLHGEDGEDGEGILYKPEDFDPAKKYPVIFNFYEKNSDEIYRFITPSLSVGDLDIPYFVSRGYIVCDPNVYYDTGRPGEGAYKAIISSAKYLAGFPWIDTQKMGLMGASFGGYQVNYIIANTGMFAAAVESAGPTDFVSGYNSLIKGDGSSFQNRYEQEQNRMGGTLWEKPELYVRNSPIFFADKISTPLLMMHNKNDKQVPWEQGIELFLALRRLRKTVWMLEYDGEGHAIYNEKNRMDFSVRVAQFFDHYLKGGNRPGWMIKGVNASLKGIYTGLELHQEEDELNRAVIR